MISSSIQWPNSSQQLQELRCMGCCLLEQPIRLNQDHWWMCLQQFCLQIWSPDTTHHSGVSLKNCKVKNYWRLKWEFLVSLLTSSHTIASVNHNDKRIPVTASNAPKQCRFFCSSLILAQLKLKLSPTYVYMILSNLLFFSFLPFSFSGSYEVPRHISFEEEIPKIELPNLRSWEPLRTPRADHYSIVNQKALEISNSSSTPIQGHITRRESSQLVHKEALQTLAQQRNCTSWKEEKIQFKAKSELLRKLTQLQKRSYCLTLELSRYVLHQMWTLGFHIDEDKESGAVEHKALNFLATSCSALKRKHPRLFNLLHLPPPTRLL